MGPRFTVTPQRLWFLPWEAHGSRGSGRNPTNATAWTPWLGAQPLQPQQTDPSSAGPQETTGPSERACPGPIFKLSLLLHFCQNYKKYLVAVRPVLKTTLLLKAVMLSQPQFSCLEPAVLVWILRKV